MDPISPEIDESVEQNKAYERILGLDKLSTFKRFAEKIEQSKKDLVRILKQCKKEGKKSNIIWC